MTLSKKDSHAAFFRQSGWLMITGVGSGLLMACIYFLARIVGKEQYVIFYALLSVVTLVPAVPLQMVFAQQTAAALALNRDRQYTGMLRSAWVGSTFFWVIGAAITLLFQSRIMTGWNLTSPVALWLMLIAILLSIWMPIFMGTMLGQQNFFWVGWAQVANAIGRIGIAALLVIVLSHTAAAMMAGVVIGLAFIVIIGVWQSRELWQGKSEPFHWGNLLKEVVPLLFGFMACQFLFTGDTMFVAHYFDSNAAAPYMAAGILSRALLYLVQPLASVMFPKIVHSSAKAEKTNLQIIVLIGTAILAFGGLFGLWLFGPLALKIMFGKDYVSEAMTVLLWYAGAMIPLTLANVLVNDLLARLRFGIVPVIVILAVAYGFALTHFHASLVMVLQTLGVFNLLLFAACAWFQWGMKTPSPKPLPQI